MAAIKEELGRALAATIVALRDAEIPFALVGGLAVGVRAEPRVTRDIDLVVPAGGDQEVERHVFALQHRGFAVESVFERDDGRISTVRTRHRRSPDVLVDFLFSNPRIEAEIVAEATDEPVVAGLDCPVAQSWHLLAMKMLANRPKDRADLQSLVERGTVGVFKRARAALKLMQRRGAGPGRDLPAELDALIAEIQRTAERPASAARLARLRRGNRPRRR